MEGKMVITVNIYYQSINGNAKKFAEEMISSGIVNEIRSENGNIRYDYFFPMDDNETVLLIDSWNDQRALDIHHASSMMKSFRYSHLS
jgi:quinol monooxygenase YgiN